MKRMMILGVLGGALLACGMPPLTPGQAFGQDTTTAATPANAHAQPAAQEHGAAANLVKEAELNAAKAARAAGDLKVAAEALAGAQQAEAAAREALAKAWEANDSAQINEQGQVVIPRLAALTHRARRKLAALEAAARLSEPLPPAMINDTPEGAKASLEAFAAAMKAAAEAYTRYAAAITPEASAAAIEDAHDEARASEESVQLAGAAWNAAKAMAYRKAGYARFSSPELDKKVQEMEKLQKELLETQRQANVLRTRARKLERDVTRVDAEAAELAKKLATEPATPAPAAK